MPKEKRVFRERYLSQMEKFMVHATGEWADKAWRFIADLRSKLTRLSDQAFKQALLTWDALIDKAPKEALLSYAISS